VIVVAVAIPTATSQEAAAAEDAPPLPAVGASVDGVLAGGATAAWNVELTAGDFLRVVVEQRGIDVVVRLLDPGGAAVREIDSPNGARGPERLSWVVQTPGRHRLQVISGSADDPPGSYTLTVAALHPATPRDRHVAAAEEAEQQAIVDDFLVHTAESRQRALESYRQALGIWQELGDEDRQAELWNSLGFVHSRLGDAAAETAAFEHALELRRRLDGDRTPAFALFNLAAAYQKLGRLEEAEDLYRQALAAFQAEGSERGAASAWNGLGSLLSRRGDLAPARAAFERALELSRGLGDRRLQAQVLNNAGVVHRLMGHPDLALDSFTEALHLARAERDTGSEAAALNNSAVTYRYQGRMQEALELQRQLLDLQRRRGDRRGEAIALNNLATIYTRLGKSAEARDGFRRTLELNRASGDPTAEAKTLSNLGWTYQEEGDLETAGTYFEQALALSETIGDQRLEAAAYRYLGKLHRQRGDLDRAGRELARGLALSRQLGVRSTQALLLAEQGRLAAARGDAAVAVSALTASLDLQRELRDAWGQAEVHFELAAVHRGAGRLDAARGELESALALLEEIRGDVAILDLRSSLVAVRRNYHDAYVDLLMELDRRRPGQGWDAAAFAAAEQARARSLLDLLRESEIDVAQGADPELLAAERELRGHLNALERRRLEVAAEEGVEAAERTARLDALENELRQVREDHQSAEARIRTSNPAYAALTRPRSLAPGDVAERLLDPDTVLLTYYLGERRGFLQALSRDGLTSFELPPRSELEDAARTFYAALREPGGGADELARRLGEWLLAPAAATIAGRRVVVVADGALHYVPFAALPDPAGGGPGGGAAPPLVVGHEVVSLPSVSVLEILRREEARDAAAAPRKLLAVFADPVFQATDPRVHSGDGDGDAATRRDDTPGLDYRRLRFSAREAASLAALVPADESWQAVGFAASRAAVTRPDLARYRFVHFATHGVLNTQYPELSGLVLSLVDENGEPEDGFLRLHDVYELHLDADLVTLSACRTALGQEMRGEGLVGLTRGFMYAGARRVMASLWDVQDRATAEIMERFYRGMLEDGRTPAAALRAAQTSMLRDARWSAPYYWAPFVLQGDWR